MVHFFIEKLLLFQISMFNNEAQGQSGPGFSWLVFSSKKDSSIDPSSSLSPNYTFTESDKQKVMHKNVQNKNIINPNKILQMLQVRNLIFC